MDPNEALRMLRQAIDDYHAAIRNGNTAGNPYADRISDVVAGLDEWLSRGGFLPDAWNAHNNTEARQRGMTR